VEKYNVLEGEALKRNLQEENKLLRNKLRDAQANLEIKIQERNKDLVDANRKLQDEIAETKKSNIALRETADRFKITLEGSSDGRWDWNIKTNEVYTDNWLIQMGYAPGELPNIFQTWIDLLHPDDYELAMKRTDEIISGKEGDNIYGLKFRVIVKCGVWSHDQAAFL
jgi:PAS domain-containing protein